MAAPTIRLLRPHDDDPPELLAGLREGRPDAYRSLYHRHLERVLALTYKLLRDRHDAEEAAQETFVRVFRAVGQFRHDSKLSTWIHRIAVNICLDELQRRPRRHTVDFPELLASDEDLEGDAIDRQQAAELEAILDSLTPIKSTTFYLHYMDGMTATEIGELLSEGRGNVVKRLERVRDEVLALWQAAHPGEREGLARRRAAMLKLERRVGGEP